MWTAQFWKQAAERGIKTAAQAFVLVLAGDGANVLHLNPTTVLGSLLGGFILSVATSIATAGIGEPNDPSAVSKVS